MIAKQTWVKLAKREELEARVEELEGMITALSIEIKRLEEDREYNAEIAEEWRARALAAEEKNHG